MVKNILNYEGVIARFYDEFVEKRDFYRKHNYEYQDVFYDIFGGGDASLPYTYYADAEEVLLEVGVFEVLGEIKEHQMNEYGETYVDWSDSCDVASAYFNMLAYEAFIENVFPVGDFFFEIMDKFVNDEDDEQLLTLLETDLDYFNRGIYE